MIMHLVGFYQTSSADFCLAQALLVLNFLVEPLVCFELMVIPGGITYINRALILYMYVSWEAPLFQWSPQLPIFKSISAILSTVSCVVHQVYSAQHKAEMVVCFP